MDWLWFLASYWILPDLRRGKTGLSKARSLAAVPNAGTIMYETHIYAPPGVISNTIDDLERVTSWFSIQLDLTKVSLQQRLTTVPPDPLCPKHSIR